MKNLLDELDDFMDGKIFGEVAPTTPAEPKVTEPKPKEKKSEKRETQVGSTFITIGVPGASAKASKGKAAGKQKQNDDAGESDVADDSDDADE